MGNAEHRAKLQDTAEEWNRWRDGNNFYVDLQGEYLAGTPPKEEEDSLGWWTELGASCFRGKDLSKTYLNGANLRWADLREANLRESELVGADLHGANLSGVDLRWSNLVVADLTEANLRGANLKGANLREANLAGADLTKADISSAILQYARFQKATLTDSRLWESQRAGWRIEGILCERVFWDETGKIASAYSPGEFERIYSAQTSIELFYENGVSTFEISTLPALLQHLASKHPTANIRLKAIEETGGGAKITISLGNVDEQTQAHAQADATELMQYQLALRHNEGRLQQLQENFNNLLAYMTQSLIASAAPQNYFNAPIQNAFLSSGNATQDIRQTYNAPSELLQLIDKFLTHNTELTPHQSAEVEAAKAELHKSIPDKSILTKSLSFLKTLPKEAVLKGVGEIGKNAVDADWTKLLHQLSEFIHHLH